MKKLLSTLILFCFVIPVTIYAQHLNPDWIKTFGGSNDEEGASVHQTTDGGYITVGYTYSFGAGGPDIWLIKTDSNGDTLWTKTFGGPAADGGTYVQQTVDGGFVIIGTTNSFGAGNTDYLLMKTDSNGDSLWFKTFGGVYNDVAFSGQQTSDNGYIIVGYNQHTGFENSDIWLVKTDSYGDTLWTKTFGGEFNELPYSAQQTSDDGYIITGYTYSYGEGNSDVWLIKTDSNGDSLWTKTFGGSSNEAGQSVIETSDNGLIVCGYSFSFSPLGDEDIWLIKTDSDGNTAWMNTLIGSDNEIGFSIDQTTDDGFIITGSIQQSGNNDRDLLLLRVNADGQISGIENFGLQTVSSFELEQNYPNPFNPITTIKYAIGSKQYASLKVYDVLGNEIATLVNEEKSAGTYTVNFNAVNLPSGIYFYRMKAGSFSDTKKFILMK